MLHSTNTIENNILAAYSAKAPAPVLSAIRSASAETGVDFAYMVQQAEAESAFDATAKAGTSSARGLYQFIESTWLSIVEKHGASHGVEVEGKSRSELLELRDDPKIASFMAAELARDNKNTLDANWAKGQKEIGSTELYFAHFLGAGGASAFMNARDDDGGATAAHIFPAAARANKNVFYDRATGRAKSLDEVYAHFDRKFDMDKKLANVGIEPNTEKPRNPNAYRPARIMNRYGSLMTTNSRTENIQNFMNGFTAKNSIFEVANASMRKSASARKAFGGFNAIPITNLISSPAQLMFMAELGTPYDARLEDKAENNSWRNTRL